jgi:hypothetical protein
MLCFFLICYVWKNQTIRFHKPDVLVFVVLLTKSDVPVSQIGLSGFDRQNICFYCFNFREPLAICIT